MNAFQQSMHVSAQFSCVILMREIVNNHYRLIAKLPFEPHQGEVSIQVHEVRRMYFRRRHAYSPASG